MNRVPSVEMDGDTASVMRTGLDRIRQENEIPDTHPAEVLAAAEEAAARVPGSDHVDRTDVRFMTLDPASSTDLDQAFALDVAGDDIILHYAIADVGWFVRPGDPLDTEAFERAVTVYLPDRRATLYPAVLSEGAASLLPDVDRPAVVFTVRVASDGSTSLDGVERSLIRSRAKLAYTTVDARRSPHRVRRARAPDRGGRDRPRRAPCRVPGAGDPPPRWRRVPAPLPSPAPGGGAQRRPVALDQPRRGGRVVRGEDGAVQNDARRHRSARTATAALGAGVRPRLADRRHARRVRNGRCRATTRARPPS